MYRGPTGEKIALLAVFVGAYSAEVGWCTGVFVILQVDNESYPQSD